ncbi:MAG: SPOR domain-containing protein [Pseudomonadota bacterium]
MDDRGRPPQRGGLRSIVFATLWAAASVGVLTLVMMWAFDLGSRNPAEVPALSADGAWKTRPADPEGRRVPGTDRFVYDTLSGGGAGSAEAIAEAFSSAPVERPAVEDLAAIPELSAIAPDQGAALDTGAFAALSATVAAADPTRRRTILLDDPTQPQRKSSDFAPPNPPSAPPNVGSGVEPPPSNAAFFQDDATVVAEGRAIADGAAAAEDDAAGLDTPGVAPALAGGAVDLAAEVAAADPSSFTPNPTAAPNETNGAPPSAGADAPAAAPPADATPSAAAAPPAAAPAATEAPTVAEAPGAGGQGAGVAAPAPRPTRPVEPPRDPVFQVQLAALDSVAAVERRWASLRAREPEVLNPFELQVQPVTLGSARLYRLRIGEFERRSQAARLCVQLRDRGIDCFPATK